MIILIRLTWPSTAPELHGSVRPATGFLIGVMWFLTAGVATLAGPIHVIRLRRAQGLPNHPVFTVG
ncbi:hypothetical protein [Streptomyces sp. NPDC002676]